MVIVANFDYRNLADWSRSRLVCLLKYLVEGLLLPDFVERQVLSRMRRRFRRELEFFLGQSVEWKQFVNLFQAELTTSDNSKIAEGQIGLKATNDVEPLGG